MKEGLTPKQQKIYEYICTFTDEHGYPPSVREIGEAVNLRSPSTVHFHLKGLEEAGMIVKSAGKTRANYFHNAHLPASFFLVVFFVVFFLSFPAESPDSAFL